MSATSISPTRRSIVTRTVAAGALGVFLSASASHAQTMPASPTYAQTGPAAAAQWDNAFNSGDAAKVAQGYAKNAVLLPAGGQQVTGQQGAETLFASFIKGGVKNHKITVQGGEQKGDLGYAYGRWEADAGGKKLGGHWTNVLINEGGQWRTALHTWTLDQ